MPSSPNAMAANRFGQLIHSDKMKVNSRLQSSGSARFSLSSLPEATSETESLINRSHSTQKEEHRNKGPVSQAEKGRPY